MKEFNYTITDEIGIHARPAGMLVSEAKKFKSDITITNNANGKSGNAKGVFGVMGLAVKCGNEVKVQADGEDEDAAIAAIEEFFKANL